MEHSTRGKPWQQQRESVSKSQRARKRYNDARKVLPGYPVTPRKFTYDEIIDYYNTDEIECLRCGRTFRSLSKHLTFIHDMSIQEYKDLYGLPNKRGLTGIGSTEKYREAAKRRLENPDDPSYKYFTDETIREEIRKRGVVASINQRHQPFRSEVSKKNLPK